MVFNKDIILQWTTSTCTIGATNYWVFPVTYTNTYSVLMSTTLFANTDVFYGALKDTISQCSYIFYRPYMDGNVLHCHLFVIGY